MGIEGGLNGVNDRLGFALGVAKQYRGEEFFEAMRRFILDSPDPNDTMMENDKLKGPLYRTALPDWLEAIAERLRNAPDSAFAVALFAKFIGIVYENTQMATEALLLMEILAPLDADEREAAMRTIGQTLLEFGVAAEKYRNRMQRDN